MLCWPAARSTFTLNRELVTMTTFATDSRATASEWSRNGGLLRVHGVVSWDCDRHTWIAYADLDGELQSPRTFVVSDGEAPTSRYALTAYDPIPGIGTVIRLFHDDAQRVRWLRVQRPLRPLDRYPVIFDPLADGPYSPHNNMIDDARHFFW